MAPMITQAQRTWLYVVWPITFVVHILQIRCMQSQPKSLQFSIFIFAILTLSFFGGFTACDGTDTTAPSSDTAFALFTVSEIICMLHVIFLQYVSTIYPLAATIPSSRGRLGFRVTGPVIVAKGMPLQSGRRNLIILGILIQCILVGVGAGLLAQHGTELVFGTTNISYLLELGLYIYYLTIERRTRTSNLWWWTGITATTAVGSITLLIVGLYNSGVPVFGLECIFALFDSLGGVFRHYLMNRSKDENSKDAPTRPLRSRRDTPSFGDFCTTRSDTSSSPNSPAKSDLKAIPPAQLQTLPPPLPPPPPPTIPKSPLIGGDTFFLEKSIPRTPLPVLSIPMNPRLFSDMPEL